MSENKNPDDLEARINAAFGQMFGDWSFADLREALLRTLTGYPFPDPQKRPDRPADGRLDALAEAHRSVRRGVEPRVLQGVATLALADEQRTANLLTLYLHVEAQGDMPNHATELFAEISDRLGLRD